MIVFPLIRSVGLKAATASSRAAILPMFVRSRPSRTRWTSSLNWAELVYNDQNNVAAQRSVSDFDREHRFVINGTWNVPGPEHATSAAVQKLGNGWSISYIVTLQSGLPFSILDGAAGTLFGPATTYTTAELAVGRHSRMPVAVVASAAVSMNFSTRKHLFRRRSFQMAALLMGSIRLLVAGRFSETWDGTS